MEMSLDSSTEDRELCDDDFAKLETLAKSPLSEIVHAIHIESGGHYALKILDKRNMTRQAIERAINEIEIMSICDHPNVMGLSGAFETHTKVTLVLELMEADLFDMLVKKKRYTEAEARLVTYNLLQGISYLHAHGIVHRDLKPENILVACQEQPCNIKIADFGLAKLLTDDCGSLSTPCGTVGYAAPEITTADSYKSSVDLWSLGIILYTLLSGTPPFLTDDESTLADMVVSGTFTFTNASWRHVSLQAKDLVSSLLQVDPERRISAAEALRHPWLRDLHAPAAATAATTSITQSAPLPIAGSAAQQLPSSPPLPTLPSLPADTTTPPPSSSPPSRAVVASEREEKPSRTSSSEEAVCSSDDDDNRRTRATLLKRVVNLSIDIRRDGLTMLRSATESCLWQKRLSKASANALSPMPLPPPSLRISSHGHHDEERLVPSDEMSPISSPVSSPNMRELNQLPLRTVEPFADQILSLAMQRRWVLR